MPAPLILAASLLATFASASPLKRQASSASVSPTITLSAQPSSATSNSVGLSVSDAYPPSNTLPDTALFPSESVVGFQQATPTGVEPFAAETGVAWPTHDSIYPLVVPASTNSSDEIDIAHYWGNLSPAYSVSSKKYGLDSATPRIPDTCSLTQAHLYFRHGARYPTSDALPATFAAKLHNASLTGFSATGNLSFLNTWTYKLGAELLTPFGRQQDFQLGVAARNAYGGLLNNFTEAGTLPVWRTQSQDRMVKTMLNFAGGFFGIPEYQDSVSIEIGIEAEGYINSGAPYESCPNADKAYGSVGSTAAKAFVEPYFNSTAQRLSSSVSNLTLDATDITAMLQLCAYETVALGYSEFCPLFTNDEWKIFEQYYDISFYANNGPGSPVAAAQGLGYLQELVARLNHTLISNFSMEVNSTLDGSETTFPLNQSIYADAAHEVSIADALTALNLTALGGSQAPSNTSYSSNHTYVASQIVPFATELQVQVVECSSLTPTKQIRFIVNDAVIPLTYEGCDNNKDGLCSYDTVLQALIKRIDEIDFDYDCNGNYTLPYYGQVTDGRAPR